MNKTFQVSWAAVALLLVGTLATGGCDDPASPNDVSDVALDTDAEDTIATETDVQVGNPDGCPEFLPLPWVTDRDNACPALPDATECRYAAPGCAVGDAPEHVCTCQDGKLQCPPVWSAICLPVSDTWANDPTVRPAPPHRPTPPACQQLPAATDTACVPDAMGTSGCATDSECGSQERCMETHTFGGSWDCQCQANECSTDDQCGDGQLCNCGTMTSPVQGCDGHNQQCMNDCVPTECRVDADCGAGGLCSPVMDLCGWQVVSYACHDPSKAECLSDAECSDSERCSKGNGDQGWSCISSPICE